MTGTRRPRSQDVTNGDGGLSIAAIGAAVAVLMCCAGPALRAAGTLGVIGTVLANLLVIAAAVLLAAVAMGRWMHRRRRRSSPPLGDTQVDDPDRRCR